MISPTASSGCRAGSVVTADLHVTHSFPKPPVHPRHTQRQDESRYPDDGLANDSLTPQSQDAASITREQRAYSALQQLQREANAFDRPRPGTAQLPQRAAAGGTPGEVRTLHVACPAADVYARFGCAGHAITDRLVERARVMR